MKKFTIKMPVVGYVEKEVVSDSLREAIEDLKQLTLNIEDIERFVKFKVLDYSTPYNLFEVIEEVTINKYSVSLPFIGYYTADVEASSKEEAIEMALDKSEEDLKKVSRSVYDIFEIDGLESIPNSRCLPNRLETCCEQIE